MKKFLFLMPLMAMSLLASCNKSISTLPIKSHYYMRIADEIPLIADDYFEYNNKGLLIKDTYQYVQGDAADVYEYKYDEKGNVTKLTTTRIEGGKIVEDPDIIEYTYTYDKKGRITKEVEKKSDDQTISEYTYEADSLDWKTFKRSTVEGEETVIIHNVTRTFKDGLYQTAIDSITKKHYYYTWDKYKCNTKIETYEGEEKTPTSHLSDQTYEYHKNMPNKVKKYVLSYYNGGEIESTETHLTEYDEHDRMIKISNYDEQVLNSYWEYEYKD